MPIVLNAGAPPERVVTGGGRLGPFRLAPGVTARNAATLMFASFSTISFVTFLSFLGPYLFEVLQVPAERQGALAGALVSLQETVQIVIGGFIGAWSDRAGRRPIFVGGLALMAVGFILYPLAGSEAWLIGLRVFYSVGMTAATVMLSTCIAEYIQEGMRGRWMGTIGVCNGIGVVLMATVFARLPDAFSRLGFSDVAAVRASFWVFAACILLLAVLVQRGLRAPVALAAAARVSLLRRTIGGLTIARENPRIALGYLCAFASRGDLVIVTTFISLWVVQAGMAAGLSVGAATARAGMVFGISQGVALLWSMVMGLILDRAPRLVGVCIAFGLAAAGYLALGMVEDPLSRGMIVAAIFAGIGEASAVVSAGVLIGQEAPAALRGAVFGTFGLSGSIGMVCLTFAGGQVFDLLGPNAPFLMMGTVNFMVFVVAVLVHRKSPVVSHRGPAHGVAVRGEEG